MGGGRERLVYKTRGQFDSMMVEICVDHNKSNRRRNMEDDK